MDIYTDKIQVEISAVVGNCVVKLHDFANLHEGSILKLGRSNDCNVSLNAKNIIIARGIIQNRNGRLEVEVKEKL